jgi:hypothetical protein
MGGERGARHVSLWFYTDRADDLYQVLKAADARGAGGGAWRR